MIFSPQMNKLKQIKRYICSSHYPNLTGSQSLHIIHQSSKKGNEMEKKERERVRQCVTEESSIRTKCLEDVYVHIFAGVLKMLTAHGCKLLLWLHPADLSYHYSFISNMNTNKALQILYKSSFCKKHKYILIFKSICYQSINLLLYIEYRPKLISP